MRTSARPHSRNSKGHFSNGIGPRRAARFNSGGKFMTIHASVWLLHRKRILVIVGLPVLVALWWAFRPEKLWINEKVNEAAPFDTSSDPQPILTGRFEGEAHQTS